MDSSTGQTVTAHNVAAGECCIMRNVDGSGCDVIRDIARSPSGYFDYKKSVRQNSLCPVRYLSPRPFRYG